MVSLAADKSAVFVEIARVLRPAARVGITDIVAQDHVTPAQRAERGSYIGCIAGALAMAEARSELGSAGLEEIEVLPTHAVADAMHSVVIRARKPGA